jgi:hypothetical protein
MPVFAESQRREVPSCFWDETFIFDGFTFAVSSPGEAFNPLQGLYSAQYSMPLIPHK